MRFKAAEGRQTWLKVPVACLDVANPLAPVFAETTTTTIYASAAPAPAIADAAAERRRQASRRYRPHNCASRGGEKRGARHLSRTPISMETMRSQCGKLTVSSHSYCVGRAWSRSLPWPLRERPQRATPNTCWGVNGGRRQVTATPRAGGRALAPETAVDHSTVALTPALRGQPTPNDSRYDCPVHGAVT